MVCRQTVVSGLRVRQRRFERRDAPLGFEVKIPEMHQIVARFTVRFLRGRLFRSEVLDLRQKLLRLFGERVLQRLFLDRTVGQRLVEGLVAFVGAVQCSLRLGPRLIEDTHRRLLFCNRVGVRLE